MIQTFFLHTPHGSAWIMNGRLDHPLPHHGRAPSSYTLILDGFDEAFLQETWPALSWYEKKSYAKNRLLKIHNTSNVHLVRAHPQTLQGASTTFEVDAPTLPAQDFLKGVTLLAWRMGTAFQAPTLLFLSLPFGRRRLYFFKNGAPLFSRTLNLEAQDQNEALDATLYHIERAFQTPQDTVTTVFWDMSDLMLFLQKKSPAALAFAHPLQKTCTRLSRKRASAFAALAANLMLISVAAYQGTDLFLRRDDIRQLETEKQFLEAAQKKADHASLPAQAPLLAFERLKAAPHPLRDLRQLAPLNTPTMGLQALSWKQDEKNGAVLEVQVCARTPISHHEFETLVITQQKKLPVTMSLALAEEVTPVIHLEDAPPPSHPCIVLHTRRGRP
ncbi:MAG: hypothetical protein H2057_05950 [Alphaproteobacteria bacterium]|nr:hypothetical protein [Alphaproteobacteria bacterium]